MGRIQRRRSKGWTMPENAVYVGRPTKYGNPFKIGPDGTRSDVLAKYEAWLREKISSDPNFLDPLKGKDLACWCPLTLPCHADIILKILAEEDPIKMEKNFQPSEI